MISTSITLRYYDMTASVLILCDASEYGLGATLPQEDKLVVFASQTLSETEKRYAQIEKECLAICFARERFDQFYFCTEWCNGEY